MSIPSTTSGNSLERALPHNIEAEMAVLGGMMISKDAIADVVEILRAEDFYRKAHATIFEVIYSLFGSGEPADPLLVSSELEKNGTLGAIGGLPYLHSLVATVPNATNTAYYAHIVREQALLRTLVETGTRIAQLGYTTEGADVEGLINMAQSEVYAITDKRVTADFRTFMDISPELIAELESNAEREDGLLGISTGFQELDQKLNGLRPGQMIIVAARPGAGKSTLAMDFCRAAAIHNNVAAAYFSLEMSGIELSMRLLAAETGIFLDRMIKGNLEPRDWQNIAQTMERISKAPLLIDDAPNLTLGEIRAKAFRMKQQHNIGLIVIDYLQLLTSGGRTPESRQQEVSEFSRSIKLLAKELELPIIAVAQLNRDPEKRNDKRPQVSDLRESGSLEQDADVVLLIHREEMYNRDTENAGIAEIIIGKQRSGPTGAVELAFQGQFSRFADMPE